MNQINAKAFALGHSVLPLVLLMLYGIGKHPVMLLLTGVSLAVMAFLLWRAFSVQDLSSFLKMPALALIMGVDLCIVMLVFVIPNWQTGLRPTWLLLFLVPLYASEIGMRPAIAFSLLGIGDILLFNLVQGGVFFSFDTFMNLLGMVVCIFCIGRVSRNLNRLAYFDTLTLLPNRELFKERLNAAIQNTKQRPGTAAVVLLDLDKFKHVNDTMGHENGDLLLKTVAERIRKQLPKNATMARMGGDEFALLFPHPVKPEEVAETCKSIFQSLQEAVMLNNQEIYISTSIGISLYPDHGSTADQLMKNAGAAMYRAKEQGRNHYQFYMPPEGAQMPYERFAMEARLRRALEKDELIVYYQPRICTRSGKLVCVEALVRWDDPELGLIQPKDFIPLAEETGLIVPLGEQILRKACVQVRKWQELGFPDLRVSVNLSPLQFRQQNLPEVICRILRESRLPTHCLELEITESAAMQNVSRNILMLRDLKEMGVKISIDDFGTGYSSLNYLKRFPIDGLKIDRSFINGIHVDSDDAAIVHAIIVLARTLKLKVTAEGVETEGQYAYLQQQQCDEVQGYLFGKPMPSSTFEEWLKLHLTEKDLVF